MKKIQSLSYLATLAVVIGMTSWSSTLHAQNTPSARSDQQTTPTQPTPSPEMPPQAQQTPSTPDQAPHPDARTPDSGAKTGAPGAATGTDSQTFLGTVTKQGDKYVLQDDSGHTYDIDHQDDVKKFDGKRVRVQGTLDPTGKKILVK